MSVVTMELIDKFLFDWEIDCISCDPNGNFKLINPTALHHECNVWII